MILITTGTLHFSFERLISFCLEYFDSKTNENIIIQNTVFTPTKDLRKHIVIQKIIPHQEIIKLYRQAKLIISAGGEGTIIQLLEHSKNQPILFPRNPLYKEHVDDQQLKIAQEMKQQKLSHVAFSTAELQLLLDKNMLRPNPLFKISTHPPLSLISYLHKITS